MIKKHWPILTILFLSFLLRFYSLPSLPLFGDEIDVGYQAKSLLETGRDIKGNFLPFYIDSLSESRAPALIYATIPFIKIFGLNAYGVRLPPLVFGLLSIFFFYQLVLQISKSRALAIYSSSVLALSPWHFHYSRTAFELTLLSTLIIAGTYCFYCFVQKSKTLYLVFSVLFFSLSLYTYNIANIFVPLLFLFLLLTSRQILSSYYSLIIAGVLGVVLMLPLVQSITSGSATNRFQLISIFNDPSVTNEIISQRTDFTSSKNSTEKIFHNKLIGFSQAFLNNYLSAFSPQFLFLTGDPNPRHNIPSTNLVLLPLIIPLIYGLISSRNIFTYWLLVAPLSSALTQGGGEHASRLFLMIFPISYFIGLGLTKLSRRLKISILILSFIYLCLYFHQYFTHYPKSYFAAWQYGYQQLFHTPYYDSNRIFVSNTKYESLPRYIFYRQINPSLVHRTSDHETNNVIDNLSGFTLGPNIYFINNWSSPDTLQKINTIAQKDDLFYLLQLKDIPGDMNLTLQPLSGFRTLNTVFYPNGQIMGQVIQKL